MFPIRSSTFIFFSYPLKVVENTEVEAEEKSSCSECGNRAMEGGAQYNPRTVEEVFRDLKGRRTGLIKALTAGILFHTHTHTFPYLQTACISLFCFCCPKFFFFWVFPFLGFSMYFVVLCETLILGNSFCRCGGILSAVWPWWVLGILTFVFNSH